MQVYALPDELEATVPTIDYTDHYNDWLKREKEHKELVKTWLHDNGYNGRGTGGILQMPMADGYAEYMLADGNPSFLFHLPYGDGYHSPNVDFLPKKEVVKRINGRKAVAKLFGG